MIAVVWQFDVKPGLEAAFEKLHGADGPWTALSRRSRSFLGSSFLREAAPSSRYLLIEYWSEMVVYERHRSTLADEIEEIERRRQEMIASATPLGIFYALDVPDRFGPTWSRRDGY